MTYVFVFLGEFGYELFNWQGVIRKFAESLKDCDQIICCSRSDLQPIYEVASLYVDISSVPRFKHSVATCYFARLPDDPNLYSVNNRLFDRQLKADLRLFVISRIATIKGLAIDENLFDNFHFIFSSDANELNGSKFGADRLALSNLSEWPDIYDRLDITNNKYVRVSCQRSEIRSKIERQISFSLDQPFILCQTRKREINKRSTASLPKEALIRGFAEKLKVVLLEFDTGRSLDSYSKFDSNVANCSSFVCSSFLEQATLVEHAIACVFLTEGDFGSHIYVPPFMGKDVFAVASDDVYRIGTTPINFWNKVVFTFGGQIHAFKSENILCNQNSHIHIFVEAVLSHVRSE
jgi:hypothetical protein